MRDVVEERGGEFVLPLARLVSRGFQEPGEIVVVSPACGGEPAIWDTTSKTYRVQGGKLVELEEGDIE